MDETVEVFRMDDFQSADLQDVTAIITLPFHPSFPGVFKAVAVEAEFFTRALSPDENLLHFSFQDYDVFVFLATLVRHDSKS